MAEEVRTLRNLMRLSSIRYKNEIYMPKYREEYEKFLIKKYPEDAKNFRTMRFFQLREVYRSVRLRTG